MVASYHRNPKGSPNEPESSHAIVALLSNGLARLILVAISCSAGGAKAANAGFAWLGELFHADDVPKRSSKKGIAAPRRPTGAEIE